jgi:hypothetical protein
MNDHDHSSNGMAQTLARAQAAVAALARDYVKWARADIATCQSHLDRAHTAPGERSAHIQALYGVAHNIKGQGGAFGFPLITRIGQSLCRLTRTERNFSEADLALVAGHLQALRLVLDGNLTGDGNAAAQSLATQLEGQVAAAATD